MSDATEQVLPRKSAPLLGREAERRLVFPAIRGSHSLPVLLFAGNRGVGKTRMAGWAAASAVCSQPGPLGACGVCAACTQAAGLAHPDIHWYFPAVKAPQGSGRAQKIAAAHRHRAECLATLREDSLATIETAEGSYHLAMLQALREEVYRRPVSGDRKVFVLTDAERLVRSEGARAEGANAILKVLEEPPPGTLFLLTSSAPHRILPTIRSRAAELPLRPLPNDIVHAVVKQGRPGWETAEISALAEDAEGSVTRAMDGVRADWIDARDRAFSMFAAVLGSEVDRFEGVARLGRLKRGAAADMTQHGTDILYELAVHGRVRGATTAEQQKLVTVLEKETDPAARACWSSALEQATRRILEGGSVVLTLHAALSTMRRARGVI